jgi:inner membrane protein
MSGFSGLYANAQPRVRTRSAGVKLIVVCVLALLMYIPALFVQGLVTDRMDRANNSALRNAGAASAVTVDSYQSVDRSLKYVILFEGLVFLTYFIFEVTSGKRIHPAQYVLVGIAQIIFYLLLLSLSEKVGFDVGFLIAGAATVGLLSVNAHWIFLSRKLALRALAVFCPLYGLIYVLLRLKDYALLVGAVASFVAVAAAMYLTRTIDWYGTLPEKSAAHAGMVPQGPA